MFSTLRRQNQSHDSLTGLIVELIRFDGIQVNLWFRWDELGKEGHSDYNGSLLQ
jgi:hypothetical protein